MALFYNNSLCQIPIAYLQNDTVCDLNKIHTLNSKAYYTL